MASSVPAIVLRVLELFLHCNVQGRYLVSRCVDYIYVSITAPLPLSSHGLLASSFSIYQRIVHHAANMWHSVCRVSTNGRLQLPINPSLRTWRTVQAALRGVAIVPILLNHTTDVGLPYHPALDDEADSTPPKPPPHDVIDENFSEETSLRGRSHRAMGTRVVVETPRSRTPRHRRRTRGM